MFRIVMSKTLRYYEQKAIEALDVPGLEARCASLQADWQEAVAWIQVLEERQAAARSQGMRVDPTEAIPFWKTARPDWQPPEWAWVVYQDGSFIYSATSEEKAKERALGYGATADTDFDTDPRFRILRMPWERFMTAQVSDIVRLPAILSRHDAATL